MHSFLTSDISRFRRPLYVLLFSLVILGYPLVASITELFDINNRILSIPYRAIIVGLAYCALLLWVARPVKLSLPLIALFVLLYLARLAMDFVAGHPLAADGAFIFATFTLAPAVGIYLLGIKEEAALYRLMPMMGLAFVAVFYFLHLSGQTSTLHDRIQLPALNSISLGHAAASIGLLGAVLFMSQRTTALQKYIGIVLLGSSVPILMIAGARGPIVAVIGAGAWLALTDLRRILLPSCLVVAVGIAAFLMDDGNALARLLQLSSGLNLSAIERLEVQGAALDTFLQEPIMGVHFIPPTSISAYPHNIFIEVAMATGVIGLLFFTVAIGTTFVKAWTVRSESPLVTTLLVQAFIAAQFSGSIFGATQLFACLAWLGQGGSTAREPRA